MSRRALLAGLALGLAYLGLRLAFLGKVMTHVDDLGLVTDLLRGAGWGSFRNWTYGPALTPLASLAVSGLHRAEWVLFGARLLSLASWALGLALCAGLLWRRAGREVPGFNAGVALLLLALALWSRRAVLETSQAYGYGFTTAAAALALWLAVGERPRESLLERSPAAALLLGLAPGLAVLFTYQAVYVLAAVWLAWLPWAAQRKRLPSWLASGAGACAFFMAGYAFHLRGLGDVHRWPAWADGYPPLGADAAGKARFLAGAWAQAWQNAMSFLPWGRAGAALGLAGLAVSAAPYLRPGRLTPFGRRLGLYAAAVALVWTAACLAGKAPVSPTRHTFILQPLALLLLGHGLATLRLPSAAGKALALAVTAAALWLWPSFMRSCANRVDLAFLRERLAADPGLAVAGAEGAYTWDAQLLWREVPGAHLRLHRWSNEALSSGPRALLVISHRGPIAAEERERMAAAGLVLAREWAAVEPTGSTELKGIINGGNGFYAAEFRRPVAGDQGEP